MTGDFALTSLALSQPGKRAPFLTVPRIAVGLKEVNLVSREVAIATVDIECVDLKAVRDKQERIDLLGLAEKPASVPPLSLELRAVRQVAGRLQAVVRQRHAAIDAGCLSSSGAGVMPRPAPRWTAESARGAA